MCLCRFKCGDQFHEKVYSKMSDTFILYNIQYYMAV